MNNNAEDKVSEFYNNIGWKEENETTEDAKRWEDLREHAKEYVSKCRLRVLRHIPDRGEYILDMASGPIQYKEYLEFSKNFKKRYCIDLSSGALEQAKKKIGDHGIFLHGSFFDLPLEENFFDCSLSLHTIYHMDKDKQEEAVRKLIRVTKPGKPVIIVYANPDFATSLRSFFLFRVLRSAKRIFSKPVNKAVSEQALCLYYFRHPIKWWSRFGDVASVNILPWRAFGSDIQKKLLPNNKIGKLMFDLLFKLEEKFPDFFTKNGYYPMIVLTKNDT
jgi:ubiquinone/menaquinone biosynthesis C-methylase UbiE